MTRPFRGGGRRGLRAELQSTWNVYDAARPIRKEDYLEAAAPQPDPPASPGVEADEHGAARCFGCGTVDDIRAHVPSPNQRRRFQFNGAHVVLCEPCFVSMTAAEPPTDITTQTDAEVAQLFGVTEMDVRESRKWAREQAERSTLVNGDPAVKH